MALDVPPPSLSQGVIRPMPTSNRQVGQRALVLGASMAVLLAARALHEHFAQVTLLERDDLPSNAAMRKGTPQAIHAHGLLARGREALEALFPGFSERLVAQGGELGDLQQIAPFAVNGRMFARGLSGHNGIAASRLAIEADLRRCVLALPNVEVLSGIDILEPTFDVGRVTGARVALLDDRAQERVLPADLVLDCTGRGSRSPHWLRNWGYEAPPEERVDCGIAYATAYFRREPQHAPGLVAIIFTATAELPLSGALVAQEPGADGVPRWVLTLAGYADDHPALTLDAMRERARRMGSPELSRITECAELLAEPTRYTFPHSQRRRYERLKRFPERYLVLGDALTSFNPVYGQGMSVTACEALALRDALADGLVPTLHRSFFAAAAKLIDVPWQLAAGADLAIPSVPGERPAAVRFINGYVSMLLRVAPHDAEVARAFMKVAHLVAAPPTLFSPGILARVLWGARKR